MLSPDFFEASAQGRLDVMGGIADYSGSLVLQMAIRERTTVRFRRRDDFVCTFESRTESGEKLSAEIDYRKFLADKKIDFDLARQQFKTMPGIEWTAYVLGCALVLQKEKGITFKGGDFFIESNVPLGKGVSSSASLEVATMKALEKGFGISFNGTELPTLAQKTENLIVGAPCGLMDQLSSYFGEPRKLLPIICQPDLVQQSISIPDDVHFFGVDSGVRHSVGGASYGDVRCAAFMGYTIIAQSLGASRKDIDDAISRNDFSKLPYRGYLCNISVKEFSELNKVLPDKISGKEFLSTFGNSIDKVTSIDKDRLYNVAVCAAHPVYENDRVHQFRQLLIELSNNATTRKDVLRKMGELMYQAHDSYSRCGLGSSRTDEIVQLAKELGASVTGAKITGGGSGGTVCILAIGDEGKERVRSLHQSLTKKYNASLKLFES